MNITVSIAEEGKLTTLQECDFISIDTNDNSCKVRHKTTELYFKFDAFYITGGANYATFQFNIDRKGGKK